MNNLPVKSRIRNNPDEVEAWIDNEIARIGAIDFSDLLSNMKT
jgi:hypothetical protein